MILPIHATLYQTERYIVLISATLKQARRRLRNIKRELDNNRLLREVFPHEIDRRESWNANGINVNDVQIDVFSAGTELRGISAGEWRPTLVILDDVEDSEAVRSPEQRERLLEWYNETIESIGDTYTAIEIIGTLLHPDSLLATLMRRPDFESHRFASIEQFSLCTHLWEQWRALYTNLADEDRARTALAFFEANRDDMLRDTQVLWPQKENYYSLMCQMTTIGRAAFFKEKQNEPAAAGDIYFDPTRIIKFRRTGTEIQLLPPNPQSEIRNSQSPIPNPAESSIRNRQSQIVNPSAAPIRNPQSLIPNSSSLQSQVSSLTLAGFLDSAIGRGAHRGQGDYAAILTVGVDRHGYYYVLDAWIQRAAPTIQISQIFNLHALWNYKFFGIESNCFQQLLLMPIEEERARRRHANLPWQVPVQEVHHSQNKEMRLAALEPLVSNGWVRFDAALPELLWQQLEAFPRAEHDDALDALEGAIALLKTTQFQIQKAPPRESIQTLAHF